jgi:hypothetical protein
MCCIWVGYKKCDLKNTEGMACGTKENTEAFCFSQKTGFSFVELRVGLLFIVTDDIS